VSPGFVWPVASDPAASKAPHTAIRKSFMTVLLKLNLKWPTAIYPRKTWTTGISIAALACGRESLQRGTAPTLHMIRRFRESVAGFLVHLIVKPVEFSLRGIFLPSRVGISATFAESLV
jgi:hypothetical protein